MNVFSDPPFVYDLPQRQVIEGRNLSVTCLANPGNPNRTTYVWTKSNEGGFKQNGSTLQLSNIQRTGSGIYRCIAENIYTTGGKGRHSQDMVLNVLCKKNFNSI